VLRLLVVAREQRERPGLEDGYLVGRTGERPDRVERLEL
jgi:hypothetical protein